MIIVKMIAVVGGVLLLGVVIADLIRDARRRRDYLKQIEENDKEIKKLKKAIDQQFQEMESHYGNSSKEEKFEYIDDAGWGI